MTKIQLTIFVAVLILVSTTCTKQEESISPLMSNINCNSEKFSFVPPNLTNLIENFDFIRIRPNLIPPEYNLEQMSPCGSAFIPCATWNNLLFDKLAQNPNIRYVLFEPGDYRCLGVLNIANYPINPDSTINGIIGRELTTSNLCNAPNWTIPIPILSFLFYDPTSSNSFFPLETYSESQGNAFIDRQVVLEGLTLDGCQNILINGLVFDPINQFQITCDIKYFSEKNIVNNCKFINYSQIGIQIRSSQNIIQDCKFVNANPHLPQCNDPVAIYLHCDHKTRGDYNVQTLIYPCFSNKIIDNVFKNAGQAIQTAFHEGENYNPAINPIPTFKNQLNYYLASVSNTLICGNISFKTPDKYHLYENDFTFKIGSQCKLKPVYFFENYSWGNRTWNQFCPGKTDGNIGDGIVIWGWASNLEIYSNHINNSINGISGISLKTDDYFNPKKIYWWNFYDNCISNIITDQGTFYDPIDSRGIGFFWPGHYTLANSLFMQNNVFYNVEDPVLIEDPSCCCPVPSLEIEPNFNPNFWGGIKTSTNFLNQKIGGCPIWSNYTIINHNPNLTKTITEPIKASFMFRKSFVNSPNFCCCNNPI